MTKGFQNQRDLGLPFRQTGTVPPQQHGASGDKIKFVERPNRRIPKGGA